MIYGINYDGKHSFRDMGFTVAERSIGSPSKVKNVINVPFSNVPYDFSELYGEQVYNNRQLSYSFNVINPYNLTPESFMNGRTKLINWLMGTKGKTKLLDETIPGYYFLAEMEDEADIQDDWESGTVTVTFNAYPFMIGIRSEGHDIWDDFNFELDVAQQVRFDVNGNLSVNLINSGTPDVSPEFITSAPMTLQHGNISLELAAGRNRSDDFTLAKGDNLVNIDGTGTIEFIYFKELL